jgi:hypothetical protein
MTWTSVGPTPQVNEADAVLTDRGGDVTGKVSGRAQALAFSANIQLVSTPPRVPALFNGSSSGGVWITTSISPLDESISLNPLWRLISPTIDGLRELFNVGAVVQQRPVDVQRQVGINRTGALLLDPNNQRTIYVGTGDPERRGGAGILRSNDGGQSWLLISDFSKGKAIAKIVIDPNNTQRLYAAVVPQRTYNALPSDGGLWFSSDGGRTWQLRNPNLQNGVIPCDLDYVIKEGQFRLIAALAPKEPWATGYNVENSGIWIGTNDGRNWRRSPTNVAPINLSNSRIGRISLATCRNAPNPTVIFAAVASLPASLDIGASVLVKILRSPDGGDTWQEITPVRDFITRIGEQAIYDLALAAQLENRSQVRIFLGGVNVIGAGNGLANPPDWQDLDLETPRGDAKLQKVHVDHHSWVPRVRPRIFNGNDGGVWKLEAYFGLVEFDWTNLNGVGLNTIETEGAAAFSYPGGPVYLEASQDNGLARWTGNLRDLRWFKRRPGGDGGPIFFLADGTAIAWLHGGDGAIMQSSPASQGRSWSNLRGTATGFNGFPMPPPPAAGQLPVPDPTIYRRGQILRYNEFRQPLAMSSDGVRLLLGSRWIWERTAVGWAMLRHTIVTCCSGLAARPCNLQPSPMPTWAGTTTRSTPARTSERSLRPKTTA